MGCEEGGVEHQRQRPSERSLLDGDRLGVAWVHGSRAEELEAAWSGEVARVDVLCKRAVI